MDADNKNNLEDFKEKEQHGEGSNADRESVNTATKPVEWSPENEAILVEWCDVAQCYKWMNSASHEKFSNRLAWFTIPAIILSTISGTASFAQGSLPKDIQLFAPAIIGSINIFVGILTTIQQYLKIAELNESHRVSAISWDKFARNIRIELAKAPCERMDAGHFLKLCRQEFDRLMETSPSISTSIVDSFNTKFTGKVGSLERRRFDELKKPDICNIIISANEYRHTWYKHLSSPSDEYGELNKNLEIAYKERIVNEKEEVVTAKERQLKLKELEEFKKIKQKEEMKNIFNKTAQEALKVFKEQTKKIEDYVITFGELYGRKPLTDEIMDNMRDEVPREVLDKFLEKYTLEDGTNNV